jgi:hypothetical protein
MTRFELLWRYLLNNRISEYEGILKQAILNGYQLISCRDFVNEKYDPDKKIMILRHDVDYHSKGTNCIFSIEKRLGAKSSFYFRKETFDYKLMEQIEAFGSEASFHFETVAEYIREAEIVSKDQLLKSDFKKIGLKMLHNDLHMLRSHHGFLCETIASHGAEENRRLNISNNILTEDESNYSYLGIKLEAYNAGFIEKIHSYISDCAIEYNRGYRYGVHPYEILKENKEIILFLTHPNHWYYSGYELFKKVIRSFLKGSFYRDDSFKRIAKD